MCVTMMTLLVSGSRTLTTLDFDQNEVLFLTEIVCENGKNPLQPERILSSVADIFVFMSGIFRKLFGNFGK